MATLISDLISNSADHTPEAPALYWKEVQVSYRQLAKQVGQAARALVEIGLQPGERVAIFMSKRIETVVAMFAAAEAGGAYVPVNPILKVDQIRHILDDCGVSVLVTSKDRLEFLRATLGDIPTLREVVIVDSDAEAPSVSGMRSHSWDTLTADASIETKTHRRIDADVCAILYTSGSTGRAKGVVLSHRNMVAGAQSAATHLSNTAADRLLALLPLSFDYGLVQLTAAFYRGASAVLFDFLFPDDVVNAIASYQITGLSAVPPIWNQLAALNWPDEARNSLRYITSSGGRLPRPTLQQLRKTLPHTDIYLMYGLTEAFRSTCLMPDQVDIRPDSIGKAIPNAEVMVVHEDGSPCAVDEPGELVHRGPLVGLGYWNDPEKTSHRYRPVPGQPKALPLTEIAVWSGDIVRRDAEGYLYFVGRNDEMIKTSGYRVSPTEVEEEVYRFEGVAQAAAFGIPHSKLGQAIALLLKADATDFSIKALKQHLARELPAYMIPTLIELRDDLPRNANGKIDRATLSKEYADATPGTSGSA